MHARLRRLQAGPVPVSCSLAPAPEKGQDFADGGFLADGLRAAGGAPGSGAAAAAVFLLDHVAGCDFVVSEPADAQLLVSMRRADLIRSPLPPPLVERLRALNRPVEHLIGRLAGELFGRSSARARELITLAVFDLPYGSVRRHLLAGAAPPAAHRLYVELAIRAVLGAAASASGEEGGT